MRSCAWQSSDVRQEGERLRKRCFLAGAAGSFTPLDDLPGGTYRGEPGGLYPGRASTHPDLAAGIALGRAVQPRNAAGAPDPNGT